MSEELKPCPACGARRNVEIIPGQVVCWDCLITCPAYAHGKEWRRLQQTAYTLSRQLEALDPAVAERGTEIYENITPRGGTI